jgi:SpoVK/Ycf46/Vps4 family AAA+-type ATPase
MTVTAEQLKALVRRHIEGDDDGFYSVARQVAAHAAKSGQNRFAEDLRALVETATSSQAARLARPVPLVQPRGELAGLISATYPETSLDAMTLDHEVEGKLERVVSEQRQRDRLAEYGLEPIHRILLFGPPGTGKSMSAAALAHELRLPLFTIQLHVVISKYMGETAAKLRLVFDAVASTRAVYLFDEFDALGSQRSSGNDVGEARRILNSFLQFLEEATGGSLVVAATNHPQLLDRALFRRFDQVIEYGLPGHDAGIEVLMNRLSRLDTHAVNWESVAESATGMSHADLVRSAEAAAKQAVMAGRETVGTADLAAAVRDRRHSDD